MNKIKENLSLITVSVATLIYLSFIFKLTNLDEISTLKLNEIGDYLAGVFAPLAFLWLVFGYYQQGHELKLNTEALRLQADELKNAVDEQRRLNEIHKENIIQKHFEVEPHFNVSLSSMKHYDDISPIYESSSNEVVDELVIPYSYFEMILKQEINTSRNIEIVDINKKIIIGTKLSLMPNEAFVISYVFDEFEIKKFMQGFEEKAKIEIAYSDILGKKYSKNFELTIIFSPYINNLKATLQQLST